jgi:threonine dehydratase
MKDKKPSEWYSAVCEAAERIRGHALHTPVMTSSTLDAELGAEVFFKCENLQKIGAFKFRGAYNAIRKLPEDERKQGIITYSSGNHGQAVALVGRMLNTPTVVVMPDNAPETKKSATAGYGAKVVEYNAETESREEIATDLCRERNLTMIPPYDHPAIVAGQGTAAMELLEETGKLDMLLVPCGGGGLLSGSAIAAGAMSPECRIIGVEPELADDATRSFRTGELHRVSNPPTIADGTRTPSLGKITFPLVLEYVDDMQTVPEKAICDAVRFFYYRMKIVVEPSGALGLAALINGSVPGNGRIGVIISGGNIDGPTMSSILARKM